MIEVVAGVLEHPTRLGMYLIGERRADDRHYPNCWECPGGKKEPGEQDHEALRREWGEELEEDVYVGPRLFEGEYTFSGGPFTLRAYLIMLARTGIGFTPKLRVHNRVQWASRTVMLAIPNHLATPSLHGIAATLRRKPPGGA